MQVVAVDVGVFEDEIRLFAIPHFLHVDLGYFGKLCVGQLILRRRFSETWNTIFFVRWLTSR